MQANKLINLTAKRLEALRYLADHPGGVYVCAVAHEILTIQWRRDHQSGFTSQQATRSGAGYVMPLIEAGWVKKRDTDFGWGIVAITESGRALLDATTKAGV